MGWIGIRRATALCGWLGVAILAGTDLQADPITSWNGGGTSVESLGQAASEQGNQSESSIRSSTTFSYASVYDPFPGAYKVDAGGTADARVNGTADDLLQVNATYHVGNPGTAPNFDQSPVPNESVAQASWTGDRIHSGPRRHLRVGPRLGDARPGAGLVDACGVDGPGGDRPPEEAIPGLKSGEVGHGSRPRSGRG